jgi:hypothetical protein
MFCDRILAEPDKETLSDPELKQFVIQHVRKLYCEAKSKGEDQHPQCLGPWPLLVYLVRVYISHRPKGILPT